MGENLAGAPDIPRRLVEVGENEKKPPRGRTSYS